MTTPIPPAIPMDAHGRSCTKSSVARAAFLPFSITTTCASAAFSFACFKRVRAVSRNSDARSPVALAACFNRSSASARTVLISDMNRSLLICDIDGSTQVRQRQSYQRSGRQLASIRPLEQTMQVLFLLSPSSSREFPKECCAMEQRPAIKCTRCATSHRTDGAPATKVSGQGRKITKIHDDVTECSFVVQV